MSLERSIDISANPPDYFTVEEFAAICRLGRHAAYAQVRLGVETDGREGIPAERHGKQFRISRYVIEQRLGGPVTWPIPGYHPEPEQPDPEPAKRERRKRMSKPDNQPQLFLA